MKKRFSDEQIVSILRKAEAGVSLGSSTASTPFQTLPSTHGVKNFAV